MKFETEFFLSGESTIILLEEHERQDLDNCLLNEKMWFITDNGYKVNLHNTEWINYLEELPE